MYKIIILNILLFLASCADSNITLPTKSSEVTDSTLYGTISTRDGEAINGATILLYSSDKSSLISSTVSTEGTFTLSIETEGTYTLKAYRNDSLLCEKEEFEYVYNNEIELIVNIEETKSEYPTENLSSFNVTQLKYTIEIGDDFDPKEEIEFEAKNSEGNNAKSEVVFIGDFNVDKVGKYTIYVIYGNKTIPVSLEVVDNSENKIPTVTSFSVTMLKNEKDEIELLGRDSDGSISSYDTYGPNHGTISLDDNIITYVPDTDYLGEDSFIYRATDNRGAVSEYATITITVTKKVTTNRNSFDNFENEPVSSSGSPINYNYQTDIGAYYDDYVDATDNYFEGGYWYAYNEIEDDGTSYATPNYREDKEFTDLAIGGPSGEGNCLHITITLTDDVDYPFYGVGANIRKEGEYFDFSSMTAITFYTKGSGEMKVVMKTQEADRDFSSDWGDYDAPFTLTDEWRTISISTYEFEATQYSDLAKTGMGFNGGANKAVGKIHFQTNQGEAGDIIDFWIDDIVLVGMGYEYFY